MNKELIEALERLKFFNQRAGRELWTDKPREIQDEDIANTEKTIDMAISALKPTRMIDESNFSREQYKADLQSAYDCGKAESLVSGWIPIEERKPKHKQEVFVTYETEDGIKVDKTTYHERYGFAISPNVTAWREDIEPYKAESEE